jgi:hypothetical protein
MSSAVSGEHLAVYPPLMPAFKQWTELVLEYNRSSLGDVFRKSDPQGQPSAAATVKCLDLFAEALSGWNELQGSAVEEAARAAVEAGTKDPMVFYSLGMYAQGRKDIATAVGWFERSWAALADTAYPPHRRMMTAKRLATCYRLLEGAAWSARSTQMCDAAIRHAVEMLHDREFANPAKRNLFSVWLGQDIYNDRSGVQLRQREALARELANGGIDPWLQQTVLGKIEINKAWEARGGGWANTVTDEGWKGFAQHLDAAERALTKAWEIDPTLVAAPADMLVVCMGRSHDLERHFLWFNRALAAQMDCEIPYINLFQAIQPRWGGDHNLILAVGSDALATGYFTTNIPRFYIRALQDVIDDIESQKGDVSQIFADAGIWKQVSATYSGYLTEPAKAAMRDWYRTCYAGMAWRFGRHDVCRSQLDLLGAAVDPILFKNCAREELATVRARLSPPP